MRGLPPCEDFRHDAGSTSSCEMQPPCAPACIRILAETFPNIAPTCERLRCGWGWRRVDGGCSSSLVYRCKVTHGKVLRKCCAGESLWLPSGTASETWGDKGGSVSPFQSGYGEKGRRYDAARWTSLLWLCGPYFPQQYCVAYPTHPLHFATIRLEDTE